MAWRSHIITGSGTGNSSLAPRVSTPLYRLIKSANLVVPGLHQGVAGARPVIYNGRNFARTNVLPTRPKD
jgi:hypothetical protein